MANNYTSDSIIVDRTDIDNVRLVPQMYGPLGNRGLIHMIKEVLQNSIDEASITPNVVISIEYNSQDKSVVVEDNARGIPIDRIIHAFTMLHASGKSSLSGEKSAYIGGPTSGVHGVGLKYTNALSKRLIATVCREGNKYQMIFNEGVPENNKPVKIGKSSKTGTRIEFWPDESILGELDITAEEIKDTMEDMMFLSPEGTKFKYSDDVTGVMNYVTPEDGLKDLLEKKTNQLDIKLTIPPQQFNYRKGAVIYEVIFAFTQDANAEVFSYCNFCNTIEGGYHVDSFINQLSMDIKKYVDSNMGDRRKVSININDCRDGLVAVVKAMHPKPILEGQTKTKVGQTEFIDIGKSVASDGLKSIVNNRDEKKYLNLLTEYVINNAQARIRARDTKNSFLKPEKESESAFFSSNGKLRAATGNGYKELFLVEGDSAAGSMSRRNTKEQAIFPLRGVLRNVLEQGVSKILENEEIKTLVKIIKTNIGPKFDISKLAYDKIIIGTDADVDGLKISSLICVLFATHMPEIIRQGKLYKVIPPLYRFKLNGKDVYVTSYVEFLDYMLGRIYKEFSIEDKKGRKLTKEELRNLMNINKEYLEVVNTTANKLAFKPEVVEDMAFCHNMTDDDRVKYLKSKYKYFKFSKNEQDELCVEGVHGTYHFICFDDIYYRSMKDMIDLMKQNNSQIFYKINGEDSSLYGILSAFSKYFPKDITRYKGLGEMNPKQLADTTLDPANRTLIQLTMDDIEKTMNKLSIIHGSGSKNISERKALMMSFKISKDDIDN